MIEENVKSHNKMTFNPDEFTDDLLNKDKNKKKTLSRKTRRKRELTLVDLTEKFIEYCKSKGEICICLNDLQKHLKVKKRRIYDVTAVLKG